MTTHFVSGHLDLTEEEFRAHYVPRIADALRRDDDAAFVVGDAPGCDHMAQECLRALGVDPLRVRVFHMLREPRHHVVGFPLAGGFASDSERDAAMTAASDADIAWVRPGKAKRRSGTARNLERRIVKASEERRRMRMSWPRYRVTDDYAEYPVTNVGDEPVELGRGDSREWERAVPLPPELRSRLRSAQDRLNEAALEHARVISEVRQWRAWQEADPV